MRAFLLISLALFCSNALFSSPDPSIRYKLKVELENKKTYEGYVYKISIMGSPKYKANEKSFIDYFKEVHFPDTISLYKEIKTFKLTNQIELDFTSSKQKIQFQKKDIKKLVLVETYEYQIGSRLQEIEVALFNNLDFNKLNYTTSYNEQFSENCSLLLISEMDLIQLNDCKAKLDYGLKEVLKIPPTSSNLSFEVNQYLNSEKESLKQKNVLLLWYCEAL